VSRGFSSPVRESGRRVSQFVTSPDGGRGLRQRRPRGADLVEVVPEDGVTAVVAEVADLAEQAGEAAVSLAGVLDLIVASLLPAWRPGMARSRVELFEVFAGGGSACGLGLQCAR
jgi:hypothetical protein